MASSGSFSRSDDILSFLSSYHTLVFTGKKHSIRYLTSLCIRLFDKYQSLVSIRH
jgi:hypothetical protein